MKRNYVARSISQEMHDHGIRQNAIAEKIGISQPSLSDIINRDVRLSPQTLEAITHCWPTQESNVRVLIAHLRDEIGRAGWDQTGTVDIAPHGKQPLHTQGERDIDILRTHLSDADVAEFIARFANILRRADTAKKYPESGKSEWGHAAEKP